MRIAVVGTHGVGKTTLAKWISEEYQIPLLSEQAGHLLKTDFPFFETERDFEVFKQFQETVLDNQIKEESDNWSGFVADRSILDSLAYVHVRTLIERDFGNWLEDYRHRIVKSMIGRYDVLFFVRYHEDFLGSDPEIRNMNPVFMQEIDRFLHYTLLRSNKTWLNWVEISSNVQKERREIVKEFLDENYKRQIYK